MSRHRRDPDQPRDYGVHREYGERGPYDEYDADYATRRLLRVFFVATVVVVLLALVFALTSCERPRRPSGVVTGVVRLPSDVGPGGEVLPARSVVHLRSDATGLPVQVNLSRPTTCEVDDRYPECDE